jgi:hypothetical protein
MDSFFMLNVCNKRTLQSECLYEAISGKSEALTNTITKLNKTISAVPTIPLSEVWLKNESGFIILGKNDRLPRGAHQLFPHQW